jgi:hypothetical protein
MHGHGGRQQLMQGHYRFGCVRCKACRGTVAFEAFVLRAWHGIFGGGRRCLPRVSWVWVTPH